MAKVMESLVDSIVPLRPTLDEAIDLGELLSFRY
jgi:hypothetical protein